MCEKKNNEFQRYTFALHSIRSGGAVGTIQKKDDGEFMLYNDVEQKLSTQSKEFERFLDWLDSWPDRSQFSSSKAAWDFYSTEFNK